MAKKDPVVEAYKAIRDITVCSDTLPAGMAVGVLELVKAELLRDMQAAIDARV